LKRTNEKKAEKKRFEKPPKAAREGPKRAFRQKKTSVFVMKQVHHKS
jgi:hypothetical protein